MKYRSSSYPDVMLKSLPVRGAWIEIEAETRTQTGISCRSPCGERGLKLFWRRRTSRRCCCRSPCGERGLKLCDYINLRIPLIIESNPAASSLPGKNFEKKRSSSALFAREINLVTQPSFDCEQGINSQVQTACSNADAIFPVLGIVSCRNERFSLSRKTHVPLWNAPRISHVRLP